jgi:hypothetical protein
MRRVLTFVCLMLGAALLVAGCGGNKKAASSTTAPVSVPPATTAATTAPTSTTTQTHPLAPTLTSASDLAACVELTTNLRVISTLIRSSVEDITQALHPKQLAKKTSDASQNLLYSAKVIALLEVPPSLEKTRARFVSGIRRFGADYARASKATAKGDLARASHYLHDGVALAEIDAASKKINRVCGNG